MKHSLKILLSVLFVSVGAFGQNSAEQQAVFAACLQRESANIQSRCDFTNQQLAQQVPPNPSRVFFFTQSVSPTSNPAVDYNVQFLCGSPVDRVTFGVDYFFIAAAECQHQRSIGNFKPALIIEASHDTGSAPKCAALARGSVIDLDARSVGEQIPISGVPFQLSYQTKFDPARIADKTIDLSLYFNGDFQVPRALILSGPNFVEKRFNYPAIGALQLKYTLNPSDLITSNPIVDSTVISVKAAAVFDTGASEKLPVCTNGTMGQTTPAGCEPFNEPNLIVDTEILIRSYQLSSYKPAVWGLGGWTLTNHHYYDFSAQTLYYGYGFTRKVSSISTVVAPYGSVLLIASEDASEIFLFDQSGRHLETKTGLLGATIYKFKYLTDSKLDEILDGNNLSTKIERTTAGEVIGIRSPFGQVTGLELNSAGKLSKVTNAVGTQTIVSYVNDSGLMTQIRYPSGLVTNFSHTADGLFIGESKNTGGFQSLAENFENLKKLLTLTSAEGVFQKNVDDKTGQFSTLRAQFTSTEEVVQSSEISLDGRQETFLAPNYRSESVYQDDVRFGSQVQLTQSFFERTFNNPIFGRTLLTTQEATFQGQANPLELASLRTTTRILSTSETTRQSLFNKTDRSLTVSQDGVTQSQIIFDELERVSKIKSPGILDLNLTYNNLGQLTQVAQGASKYNYLYDSNGNLVEERDSKSRATTYVRDADGKVLTKTLPNGDQINFSYNPSGSLRTLTTPNNQVHRFQQSFLDQVAAYLPPILGSQNTEMTYGYDLDGRIKTMTKPDGARAEFFYKAGSNFVERISTPEGDYLFQEIDPNGLAATSVSPDGISSITRFTKDAVVFANWSDPGTSTSSTISYQLDQLFQVKSVIIDSSTGFDFEYDQQGRITKAGDETFSYTTSNQVLPGPGGTAANLAIQQVVSQLLPNFVTTSSIESTDVSDIDPTVRKIVMVIPNPTGSLQVQTDESVDVTGNISVSARKSIVQNTSTIEDRFSQYYIYDENNRLVQIDQAESRIQNGQTTGMPRRTVAQYSFGAGSNNNIQSYDHYGKLTRATYDAQDRLLKLQGAIERDFEYKPDGTLSKISNCLGVKQFEYDFFGNLKKVTLPDGRIITYRIDAFNRRTSKLVNGALVESYTWYDQTRLARIKRVSGEVITYVYGTHPIAPSYVVIGLSKYKVVPTWKGDIRYLVAEDGSIAQELIYDEYGNTLKDTSLGRTVNGQVVNSPLQPLGYVSGLTDFDTKMIRFGARDYDPVIGRWTSKDPSLFSGGDANLYSYCGQNPLNCIDPSGEVGIILPLLGGFATYLALDIYSTYLDQKNPNRVLDRNIRSEMDAQNSFEENSGGQCPVPRTPLPPGNNLQQPLPPKGYPFIPRIIRPI